MAQEIADSTLIDTWSSSGLKVEPDVSKIIEGWQLGEQPPHEYMNWLQNTFGSKLNHILKNGVSSWNNETEYLVGSSVQHNGNVWLCKATNTNSAPTDANNNWKRIITVEALTTVLASYVKTTGNQTIAGVKTFSSSPIVPNPTTDTQAANKKYVDDALSNPTLTADATLTGIDNKIVMNGIVTSLGLEVGDVIQFTSVADANNQKMRTVESIINNNEIIVNYEHCGSRGNGTLKLTNQTLTSATITRIAKWHNAPLGLGQDWVVVASRATGTTYTNTTGRTISVILSCMSASNASLNVAINGVYILNYTVGSGGGMSVNPTGSGITFLVPNGSTYSTIYPLGFNIWSELR